MDTTRDAIWFSDVVGGYLLGSLWLVLTIRFYDWGRARFFTGERQARPFRPNGEGGIHEKE